MEIFYILLIALFILTAIFYIIFFSFIYYWHLKKTSFVVVPFIFTFEFFIIGFLVISIAALAIQFIPYLFTI